LGLLGTAAFGALIDALATLGWEPRTVDRTGPRGSRTSATRCSDRADRQHRHALRL